MSALDIDDNLGSAAELVSLRKNNISFNNYLNSAALIIPDHSFFIPFGAGISEDGQRVYISNDLNTIVDGIDCSHGLVAHETTEWALREYWGIGEDYENDPSGHRLANRAEHDLVVNSLGVDWDRYTNHLDPQIRLEERDYFGDKRMPKNLALYPYPEDMLDEIYRAQSNDNAAN